MMPVNEILLLCAVGLFMGMIAVTSGGGATAGVPLVLLLGYPAASSVIAVSFGLLASFITGTFTYRRLEPPKAQLPLFIWPVAAFGSILGANLFLTIPPGVLRVVILVLLVGVLILSFTLKPSKMQEHQVTTPAKRRVGTAVIFALCVYCGFFGAGFGTFVILALMYFYGYSFLEGASAGTRFALVVGGASVLTYLFKGAVVLKLGIPLAMGCSVGGYLGAMQAQRGGDRFIRVVFIGSTVLLTLKMGYDILC
ncbi:sulfite exporter TauE/SafE family protein [Cystobacter fuscus]|uniref:sulfite exporter TauE/SafE family protein n=1 Tax=Cystobacter fuscus TaxID=43 RepID=UPI002B2F34E6|nr:sulfite exporter TauE/SafE family protein [Cystobacter fuscus]